MRDRKKIICSTLLLSLLIVPSCGGSNKVEFIKGNPKITYKEGDFFTLNGLDISKEIKSVTLNGNDIKEGQVIRKIGENQPIKIRSIDDELYQYSIDVTESNLDVSIEDFTFYELGKNGELNTSPTIGDNKMLVIPVAIKGFENNATSSNLERIEKAFNGTNQDVEFESVKSFYDKSSYGKLNFDITVANKWFDLGLTPNDIYRERTSKDPSGMGFVVDKAVEWYKSTFNSTCEEFDQDKDGFIDNIWIIYSAPNMNNHVYPSSFASTYWAATSWNFKKYDEANIISPLGYNFSIASYDFMDIGYGKDKIDTHIFIHETGHLFGLLDYYSYDGTDQASGAIDMMDLNIGDHCALSKYSLGWVEPTVIKKSQVLKLKPFESSGEFALIGGEGFNNSAFDEYFTVEYITPTGLNKKHYLEEYNGTIPAKGYSKPGIRINHCDNRGSDGDKWTENPNEISINYVSNTRSESRNFGGKFDYSTAMYNYTIMNKNYSDEAINNPLDFNYVPSDEALFFKGEKFEFNETSKYINLMPSKTNKLNKYKEEKIETNILNFSINVNDINSEYAEIEITFN